MSAPLRPHLRGWLVDTSAMFVFCTVTGMAIEIGLAGLTLEQSLAARLAAFPLNVLTARPYGLYRDRCVQYSRASQAGPLYRGVVDVFAFTSFQVPVYATVLVLTGATWEQIVRACATLALVSTFLGRPYGLFLELFRRLFNARTCSLRKVAHHWTLDRSRSP